MPSHSLTIDHLRVRRDAQEIISGVSLKLPAGELHVLMGQNGSGKSTLAQAVMGHPSYVIAGGRVRLDGQDITKLDPDKRSRAGLFLSLQQPPEVPGVGLAGFLRLVLNARRDKPLDVPAFMGLLKTRLAELGLDEKFISRNLNEGFSGGEKKRVELLQMLLIAPKYAILDEPDSGLDVDALKFVAKAVSAATRAGTGVLLITHNPRVLKTLKPKRVHVLANGRLIKSGGPSLAAAIGKGGFAAVRQ